jgi:hypothetical protein
MRVGPRSADTTASGEFEVVDGAGARDTVRVHIELGQADSRMTHGKSFEARLASIAVHVLPSTATAAAPDFEYIVSSSPRVPQMAYVKSVFVSIEVRHARCVPCGAAC